MKNIKKLCFLLLFIVVFTSCSSGGSDVAPPIFTNPTTKLAQLADQGFTQTILDEAVTMEPLVTKSGSQIHLGFWSAAGNHGSLVRVLDSINATSATATPPQRAIWDEGVTSSIQYPQYVLMNNEFWYERAYFVNGAGIIRGISYTDPFPVTPTNADDIWGAYSQRYADMATDIYAATGNVVKVWCFVNGARRVRIFFAYEFPELQALETAGVVQVFFAKTADSDWTVPDDWNEGTQNAPTPVDPDIASYSFSVAPVSGGVLSEDIAFDVADAYLDGVFGIGTDAKDAALAEFSRRNPGFTSDEYEEAFSRGVVSASH